MLGGTADTVPFAGGASILSWLAERDDSARAFCICGANQRVISPFRPPAERFIQTHKQSAEIFGYRPAWRAVVVKGEGEGKVSILLC